MSELISLPTSDELDDEPIVDDDERLTCTACGAITTGQAAYDGGWQFAPPICPNCRAPTLAYADACCHGAPS